MTVMNETVEALHSMDKQGTLETVLANRPEIHLISEKIAEINETLLNSHISPEIRDRDKEAKPPNFACSTFCFDVSILRYASAQAYFGSSALI